MILKTVQKPSLITQWVRYASEATFQTQPYKLHRLNSGPETTSTINKTEAIDMYRKMQVIRRMEQASDLLYKERKIRGFCHLYAGEEACAVGLYSVKSPDDHVITAYRCHGLVYLAGASVSSVLAELLGRSHGISNGKGGSMHMYFDKFWGGNGIVGAQTSLGTGVAFALKYTKQPSVCYTLYGDGAANQGQLAEATNMAALWKLPCVFICENNGYGLGTPIKRSSASTDYYSRGDYVPGLWVDGMDVFSVREGIKFARKYCSEGHGPIYVELATYRFYGHSVADPGTSYRTREEVQEMRKTRDPINLFKNKILDANLVTKDELKSVDEDVKKEMKEAVEFANNDKILPRDAILSDIYHNTPPVVIRGSTVDDVKPQPYVRTEELMKNF